MSKRFDRIVHDALAQGLLDEARARPAAGERHWALMVFTAFAAWLSAIPLFGVVLLGSFTILGNWTGAFVGIPLLVVSVVVLRTAQAGLFMEQLAVPGLIVGAGLLAFQIGEAERSFQLALGAMVPVACAVAVLVRQAWVRVLTGAAIAASGAFSLTAFSGQGGMPWMVAAAAWLGLYVLQWAVGLAGRRAALAAGLEAVATGMAAVTLGGMAWSSGTTFIIGGMFGNGRPDGVVEAAYGHGPVLLSPVLALAAGAWLARRWPALRTWWFPLLVLPCAVLAWFSPLLGAVLLILSVCAGSGRHGLASFAGVVAAWMIGGLYYATAWPLAVKALALLGVGVTAACIGRYAIVAPLPLAQPQPQAAPVSSGRRARLGILLCGALVLALVNVAIWQKEALIQSGTTVYVELAPVDPRSLMQGDYMRLAFALPAGRPGQIDVRAQVVARTDAHGIAKLLRFYDGGVLGQGEFLIEVSAKQGRWVLATDAWYFKEGEAERWSRARYGELRVDRAGNAVLTGLRGPQLEPL
jgi:uncharacterized membrane-anchored protein